MIDEWDDVLKANAQATAAAAANGTCDGKNVANKSQRTTSNDMKDEKKPLVSEVKVTIAPGDDAKALHDEDIGKPKETFRNYVDSAQQEVLTFIIHHAWL